MITKGLDRPAPPPASRRISGSLGTLALGVLAIAAACGSSPPSGGSLDETGKNAAPGDVVLKPNGDPFIVDPSDGGDASTFRIEEMFYGRLVEVYDHDADAPGGPVSRFQYDEFVIGEDVASDAVNYRVETNPVTQRTRLTILRKNDPDDDDDEFDRLLADAEEAARPLAAKDIGSLPPFPFVARNAAIVLRFSDALDHTTINGNTIKVLSGVPPTEPLEVRILPDPNHGILRRSEGSTQFHTTRVVIDPVVSVLESIASGVAANSFGFPPSLSSSEGNLALRIPSRTDFAASQFQSLRNASGHGISAEAAANGPIDEDSQTLDVVRALRAGAEDDANRGYLRDLRQPEIVGVQTLDVVSADVDPSPSALEGVDFVVDLRFDNPDCAPSPSAGHVLELPGGFFEVVASAPAPLGGEVDGVRVRSLQVDSVETSDLLGSGTYLSIMDLLGGDRPECFVTFVPRPLVPPDGGIDPLTQVRIRFSEPMDPSSVDALDAFLLTSHAEEPLPTQLIAGRVTPSADLQTFTYTPAVALPHEEGTAERYFVSLELGSRAVTDLAGNTLLEVPPAIPFTLQASAPSRETGHYVLRFASRDEDGNSVFDENGDIIQSRPEITGQFLYDLEEGIIRPRPVSRFSAVADRNHPVTALMNPLAKGIQTPLSPLGSRLMHVWRYCDFNFNLRDPSLYNLDVEGISWAPKNGQVVSDNFPEFRIRLAHSNRLPDERLDSGNLPEYENSGLLKGEFEQGGALGNILDDPLNQLTVVHPKEKGYSIDPAALYQSNSGTRLMPFPMNQDPDPSDDVFYTWRDTAILGRGAPFGIGVDLHVLVTAGLVGDGEHGQDYTATNVPSIGLPLLLEYSCYPNETSGGLNAFDVSLPINSSGQPNFRLFATGGTDASGQVVTKDPDETDKATGGFNPSNGGGKVKGFDITFYHGALDVVVRVSRVMTMWIDGGDLESAKDWFDPVIEPNSSFQPTGTDLVVEYRGAVTDPIPGVQGGPWITDDLFDASTYDPYGDPLKKESDGGGAPPPFWGAFNDFLEESRETANFLDDDDRWQADIDDLDGADLIQVRVTFVGNTQSGLTPELSGIGIPFERILGE